jgi:hypothetical protein
MLCRLAPLFLLVRQLVRLAGTHPSGTLCAFRILVDVVRLMDYIYSLPPNEDGEWWELSDESRGGLPYYYQTKTCETVWERPEGFVIPLGIIQVRLRDHYNLPMSRHAQQIVFLFFCRTHLLAADSPKQPSTVTPSSHPITASL